MHKHIFTLGIMLASIYTTTAIAWPTKPADSIWTNSSHTTLANLRCDSCCKTNCWLPTGTYYDVKGEFTQNCSGEPSEPSCASDKTYSIAANGTCVGTCPSGTYDIGFSSCAAATENGTGSGYRKFNDQGSNTSPYGLSEPGTWGVTFSYGNVIGQASCVSSIGDGQYVATPNLYTGTSGKYCWCRMTSPRRSQWVYYSNEGATNTCRNQCTQYCAQAVLENNKMRKSMYQFFE